MFIVPTTRKRTAKGVCACGHGQGGIYNLPTHLSHGARDLIPRMLVVDPLKRITIPEIRCATTRSASCHVFTCCCRHFANTRQIAWNLYCHLYHLIVWRPLGRDSWQNQDRPQGEKSLSITDSWGLGGVCRQHPWFTLHLPRYLAVMQADTIASTAIIDEEIVHEVVKLGFRRHEVVDSIRSRAQNKVSQATATPTRPSHALSFSCLYLSCTFHILSQCQSRNADMHSMNDLLCAVKDALRVDGVNMRVLTDVRRRPWRTT